MGHAMKQHVKIGGPHIQTEEAGNPLAETLLAVPCHALCHAQGRLCNRIDHAQCFLLTGGGGRSKYTTHCFAVLSSPASAGSYWPMRAVPTLGHTLGTRATETRAKATEKRSEKTSQELRA